MFKAIITAAILTITISAAAADQARPNTSEKQTALIKCSHMMKFKESLSVANGETGPFFTIIGWE